MRSLNTVVVLTIVACTTATCVQPPPDARLAITAVELSVTQPDGSKPSRGRVFATVHARHQAERENACDFDWQNMIAVDARGRRFCPKRATESRGASSATGAFGIRQHRTIHPHTISALYEIPEGGKIERVIIGEVFAAPESNTIRVNAR